MISLRLPWPPSMNHLYATVRGRRVLSREGKKYKQSVFVATRLQLSSAILAGMPWTVPVKMEVHAYHPDNRRRDGSNLLKIVEDSLTTARLYVDDSQIHDQRVIRKGIKKPGYIEVFIWAAGQEENGPDTETVAGEGQATTNYHELSTRFGCTEDGE